MANETHSPITSLSDEQLEEQLREKAEEQARLHQYRDYDGVDRVVESIDLRRELENLPRPVTVMSGMSTLDYLTDGFQPGELIVVSGATGHGKTTVLQTFTKTFSRDGRVPCLWFTYEVPPFDLFRRFGSALPKFYLPKQTKASDLSWLKDKIWEGVAKFSTNVVFIDHLHFLIDMAGLAQARSSSLLIGIVMRELKRIAIETNTVVFLVAHIKKLEVTEKPTINDLRDSSFVSQEADMVLLTWRLVDDEVLNPSETVYKDENTIAVVKNRRTGRLGQFKVKFMDGTFVEMRG